MSGINDFMNNKKNIDTVRQIMASPQGRQIQERLRGVDKGRLMAMLSEMTSNGDGSGTASGADLQRLVNDPNLLRRIDDFLKKNGR